MSDRGGDRSWFMASERLGFGHWRASDIERALALWGDPAVTRLFGGPLDRAGAQARLDLEIATHARHGIQYWPIFARGDQAFIGCCGLRPRDLAAGELELGFHLRPAAWGRGLAAEAAAATIGWARAAGWSALIAGHHPDNHASRKTLLRLGFVPTHDEYYPPSGMIEPCYRLPLADATPGTPARDGRAAAWTPATRSTSPAR